MDGRGDCMSSQEDDSFGRIYCVGCGKLGWRDEYEPCTEGYLCVRCSRPDLNWDSWDNGGKL